MKRKVRVEITLIAWANVIYKNGVADYVDEILDIEDICEFSTR